MQSSEQRGYQRCKAMNRDLAQYVVGMAIRCTGASGLDALQGPQAYCLETLALKIVRYLDA